MTERDWRFAVVEQPALAPLFADWLEERGDSSDYMQYLRGRTRWVPFYQHAIETVCGIPTALRCDMTEFLRRAEWYYTQHPIKRVEIVGLNPLPSKDFRGEVFFSWHKNYSQGEWVVPKTIFDLMKDDIPHRVITTLKYYADYGAAIQAVNLACQAYGESLR